MDTLQAILKRQSYRAYQDKPVPKDVLEKIVEAGRWAPNAGPYQVSVILNSALQQKINDLVRDAMLNSGIEFAVKRASLPGYQPLYSAPVVILLSTPVDAPPGPFNTALVAENMILAAISQGLATCFLLSPTRALDGKTNQDLAKEAGIPDGYKLQCAVVMGYPAPENKFILGERKMKGNVNWVD